MDITSLASKVPGWLMKLLPDGLEELFSSVVSSASESEFSSVISSVVSIDEIALGVPSLEPKELFPWLQEKIGGLYERLRGLLDKPA